VHTIFDSGLPLGVLRILPRRCHEDRQLRLLIGDSQDIVEVDETHLFKAKYNMGQVMTWTFGFLVLKYLT